MTDRNNGNFPPERPKSTVTIVRGGAAALAILAAPWLAEAMISARTPTPPAAINAAPPLPPMQAMPAALPTPAAPAVKPQATVAAAPAMGIAPGQAVSCSAMPRPAQGETFAAVTMESGAALSSATVERTKPPGMGKGSGFVFGPHEGASLTANVNIEPGDVPLFLVVSASQSTVLTFTGAVGRLSRVVLDGGYMYAERASPAPMASVGAIGVPREKLVFTREASCLSRLPGMGYARDGAEARDWLKFVFGRQPDLLVAAALIDQVDLPSGNVVAPESPRAYLPSDPPLEQMRNDMLDRAPAGFRAVDASKVEALYPVVDHGDRADIAGLLKLVDSGAVELVPGDLRDRLKEIRVKRQVEWPYPSTPGRRFRLEDVPIVYERGVVPKGPEWGSTCVLGDGGANTISSRISCMRVLMGATPPPSKAAWGWDK